MTTTHPSANDSGLNLDHLEALARAANPGPWEWWTSNSILRLSAADGIDGGVLYAYSHGGVSDICCGTSDRAFIAAANPAAVLELIALARRAALANQPAPTVPATREAIEEAAQVFEAAAAHNRSKGRTIFAHSQQSRADRIRKELDGAPAHQPAQEQAEPVAVAARALLDCCEGLKENSTGWHAAVAEFDRTRLLLRKALAVQQEPVAAPQQNSSSKSSSNSPQQAVGQEAPTVPTDAMSQFAAWKGYELPALNSDGNFDKDWLHREWRAFQAGMARAAHQPAQEQAEPTWGAVETVGDMVRNLLTLDQAAPIFTAFHVTIDGQRRCRATQGITISRERVVDGKWIDSARKDVPYANIVWAKPDERAQQEPVAAPQQAAAPGNTPEFGGIKNSALGTPEAPDTRRLALLLRSDGFRFELVNQQQHLLDPRGRIAGKGVTKRDAIDDALGIPRSAQLDGGQEGSGE